MSRYTNMSDGGEAPDAASIYRGIVKEDPEVKAIERIYEALRPLSHAARWRVLEYFAGRFAVDSQDVLAAPSAPPTPPAGLPVQTPPGWTGPKPANLFVQGEIGKPIPRDATGMPKHIQADDHD